jgi:hypothetical protein
MASSLVACCLANSDGASQPLDSCITAVQCAQKMTEKVEQYEAIIKSLNERLNTVEGEQREAKKSPPANPAPAQGVPQSKRVSFSASKAQRGTTVPIPEATIVEYCSGPEGCLVRMGMKDWDGTGRVASRHFLFFLQQGCEDLESRIGRPARHELQQRA